MTDVYKLLADIACSSIKEDWKYITIEIKSSMWEMLHTTAYYYAKNGDKKSFRLINNNSNEDLGENVLNSRKPCIQIINGTKPCTRLRKTGTSTWNLNGSNRFKTSGIKINYNKTQSTETR